jgi:hypothetical protein
MTPRLPHNYVCTSLLTLVACASPTEIGGLDVDVVDTMATVLEVTLPDGLGAGAWIEHGPTADWGQRVEPRADGTALVVGYPADTEVHLRWVDTDGNAGPDVVARTGQLPVEPPLLAVSTDTGDPWGAFLLIPAGGPETTYLTVYARDGQPVWSIEAEGSVERVMPLRDGTGIAWLVDDREQGSIGGLWTVEWRGGDPEQRIASPLAHHDFLEHDDGTIVLLESEVREVEGRSIVGDRVRLYAPDGTASELWSTFDTFYPYPEERWDTTWSTVAHLGADWTHGNGLSYDASLGYYAVSLYWLNTVVAVRRDTGGVVGMLGGTESTFAVVDDPGFGPQHSPVLQGDTVWLFDNHTHDSAEVSGSRVVRYRLDGPAGEATPIFEHVLADDGFTPVGGGVEPLPDGSVFISSGNMMQARVLDPEGRTVWDAYFPTAGDLPWRGAVLDATLQPMGIGDRVR